jgi:hypothetical protein
MIEVRDIGESVETGSGNFGQGMEVDKIDYSSDDVKEQLEVVKSEKLKSNGWCED